MFLGGYARRLFTCGEGSFHNFVNLRAFNVSALSCLNIEAR